MLEGRTVLMIYAEDTFAHMFAQQLRALGLLVTIQSFKEPALLLNILADLVVMSSGPGNPCNMSDTRISTLCEILFRLLAERRPFFSVCLSHQMLCLKLGLDVVRRSLANQGVQSEIDFLGTKEIVGFYNSFVAKNEPNVIRDLNNMQIKVCYDSQYYEVHALRAPHFISLQFHLESLLTCNGIGIISYSLKGVTSTLSQN